MEVQKCHTLHKGQFHGTEQGHLAPHSYFISYLNTTNFVGSLLNEPSIECEMPINEIIMILLVACIMWNLHVQLVPV